MATTPTARRRQSAAARGLDGLRRISAQPDPEADTCLRWWTVDFFVNDHGRVVAVTLDMWEP